MRYQLFAKSYNPSNGNKVEVVKTLRLLTGFGLKEAKDIADTLFTGNTMVVEFNERYIGDYVKRSYADSVPPSDLTFEGQISKLHSFGVLTDVLDETKDIREALHKVAEMAMADRNYKVLAMVVDVINKL